MHVTMDKVGRVVLPKRLRDELGLDSGAEFDAVIDGSSIRLQPRQQHRRTIREVEGWPSLTAVPGRTLTDDDVRALRDADQR